jgi:hypothetical protein
MALADNARAILCVSFFSGVRPISVNFVYVM